MIVYNLNKKLTKCINYRIIFLLTILFYSSILSGCAKPHSSALVWLNLGANEAAWNIISSEVRKPSVSSDEDLCELHTANLKILQSIVLFNYAPKDPDLTAKISYDYVLENCDKYRMKQGVAENQYGLYFQVTKRPGLAIQHIKNSVRYFEPISFENFSNENILANLFSDMGLFEIRDLHRNKAIKIANSYFKIPKSYSVFEFDERNQNLEYMHVLEQKLEDLSLSEDGKNKYEEMRALWSEIKNINSNWSFNNNRHFVYSRALHYFTEAGDTDFARTLLNETKSNRWLFVFPEITELILQAGEAKILSKEGKYKESAELWNDYINKFPKVYGRKPSGNDYRVVGLANEQAGNYDQAIIDLEKAVNEFETKRSSFEVAQRGQVISGLTVTAYWGLLRSYVSRYMKSGSLGDYQAALHTEGRLRARQFSELLGINNAESRQIEAMLKPDELLINYIVTDKSIVAFAINQHEKDLFLLPLDSKWLNFKVKNIKERLSSRGGVDQITADLMAVSKLLMTPIENKLKAKKRLLVVTDGSLGVLPFTLLSSSVSDYRPIVMDHEVTLFPSISYLQKVREVDAPVKYDKSLFAIADPVFDKMVPPKTFRGDSEFFYTRAVNELNLFSPLPETRTEVEKISQLFRPGSVNIAVGQNASKNYIKKQSLLGYKYLHFATHGILGNQVPGVVEPSLVLSSDSQNPESSFFTMSEIEKLKINSDLAVLSACDTGNGKYYTGEGVMGLSRGFLLAGSKSVLATLWPIDSNVTVSFMTSFYSHLKSGKSKSESLRQTQLEFMKNGLIGSSAFRGLKVVESKKTKNLGSHPYYWAAFILTGE
ncbi:CHAT domain-containing protein [Trichlorobacter lovleyi]|uniref:CHAT domain-containing protein n=1 Tax=Trichlorobacter lovleyi TaxID=313985 RepID=UPI00224001C5|nr:CHAT domain-containing protein [Trichlorobacter lovleyi]